MRKKVLTIAGKFCLPSEEKTSCRAEKKVLTVRGKNSLPNGGKNTLPLTLEWDGDRFRRWAKEVGPNTYLVINSILTSGRIEQQTYRSCMGVMRLADKHSKKKLETVCRKALQFTASPSYKGIKNLFATMKPEDFAADEGSQNESAKKNPYSLTRGAKYYGGNRNVD